MQKNLVLFTLKLLLYSIIIGLLFSFAGNLIPPKFYFAKATYLIVFFFLVTLVFHAGLLRSSNKSNNRSIVNYFMIGTTLKFLVFLAIIIGYGLLKTGNAIAFMSNFFALYILYTVFEVSVIYSQFSSKTTQS
jgi:hypothetical protein